MVEAEKVSAEKEENAKSQTTAPATTAVAEQTSDGNEETESVLSKHNYTVGQFDGPLDLLWTLIRDNKINIYDIPIAQITEQYLEYLDYAATTDLADLSEFYNMAARLIYIKSRMMLPVEVKVDDDEFDDPREELVDKLIEYQKFKKLSTLMEEKEDENEWSFERKKIQRVLPFEDKDLWEKIDTWDLLQQMQKMFRNMLSEYSDERILDMSEKISVQEKITLMNEFLDNKGECLFTDLIVRRGSEMDVICAFMAVLEAVKIHTASIYQNRMFGDIKICRYKAA